jgi:hypothetical protein
MAKITDPDDLNVGTEITVDTAAKTFTLNVAGNLTSAKEGVTLQALYSKFVDLWLSATYNKYPFPMYVIDSLSGQYIFGFDGTSYSGWKPANDATRQMLRDGGWSEYSVAGVLNRQYVGIVSLGSVNSGAQLYYIKATTDGPSNFTFTDAANEGIQVYGDASNGNFDKRTYFKGFVREYSKKYKDSTLDDTAKPGTGAFIVNLLLSNEDDLKIGATDVAATGSAPYSGINVSYFTGNVPKIIGGTPYNFNKVINGQNATAEQIYTKIQYLLRFTGNINHTGTYGAVTGKVANSLLSFVGDTLYTASGVYIDNYDNNDINRIVFTTNTNTQVSEPFTAGGTLSFNSFLTEVSSGYYRMYMSDYTGSLSGYNYGQASGVTVLNASNVAIAGTITSSSISWTFAYDTNAQSGRTPAEDCQVTVVAGNAGYAKPVVTTHTITRSVGQNISLVAEQDRGYLQ